MSVRNLYLNKVHREIINQKKGQYTIPLLINTILMTGKLLTQMIKMDLRTISIETISDIMT